VCPKKEARRNGHYECTPVAVDTHLAPVARVDTAVGVPYGRKSRESFFPRDRNGWAEPAQAPAGSRVRNAGKNKKSYLAPQAKFVSPAICV